VRVHFLETGVLEWDRAVNSFLAIFFLSFQEAETYTNLNPGWKISQMIRNKIWIARLPI
jgi:hypothetical protein